MKRNIFQSIKIILCLQFVLIGFAAPVYAAPCSPGSGALSGGVLEITPWYKYLDGETVGGKCRPKLPENNGSIDIARASTLILAAIIELVMRFAGLIAAGYIIYGAIQYITSQGEPEALANAKNTIVNALIGFVIIVLSIGIVQFLGRAFV